MGAVLGCRFAGTAPRLIVTTRAVSVVVTAIMGATTAIFALLLGYAPGGLVEMSLIAVVLHAEVAFVAAHHLLRITFVMLAAAPVFQLGGLGRS